MALVIIFPFGVPSKKTILEPVARFCQIRQLLTLYFVSRFHRAARSTFYLLVFFYLSGNSQTHPSDENIEKVTPVAVLPSRDGMEEIKDVQMLLKILRYKTNKKIILETFLHCHNFSFPSNCKAMRMHTTTISQDVIVANIAAL